MKRPRISQASKKPAPSGQKNFALIAKVVNHLKGRYLDGDADPLSLHEALEECNSTNLVCKLQKRLKIAKENFQGLRKDFFTIKNY